MLERRNDEAVRSTHSQDYFLSLIGWERFRAAQFGIRHFCTLALNPKEANDASLADGVLELLPRYLEKESVVAVGEIGYDDMTAGEERIFAAQIELAAEFDLPILIHTPHRDKKRGTERSLALVRDCGFPEARTLIDHNNEETLPIVLATECWAGHSIYPNTKMDERRMVRLVQEYGSERIIINSAADWGVSDPLKVPKTVAAMREAGIEEGQIETIVWRNPLRFFSASGRVSELEFDDTTRVDQREQWEGNSVLRGQSPRVDV
jgi:predicted metal-dependent TIM-barrel fold hydrolase